MASRSHPTPRPSTLLLVLLALLLPLLAACGGSAAPASSQIGAMAPTSGPIAAPAAEAPTAAPQPPKRHWHQPSRPPLRRFRHRRAGPDHCAGRRRGSGCAGQRTRAGAGRGANRGP